MYEVPPSIKGFVFDYRLSAAIAERIHAVPKACWTNALTALRILKQLEHSCYVEGWAVPLDNPIPIEHGWVETEQGIIVDPTFAAIQEEDNPETYYRYFAGVRYTKKQLQGIHTDTLPQVWKFGGWGGYQYPPYRKAYEQALELSMLEGSPEGEK